MSSATAPATPAWELALATTTVRQFGKALAVALVMVLVGSGLYLLESRVLRLERQFIENPADVMMRALGMAHFLIGLLYLATSARIRTRTALLRLLLAALAALAACWLFAYFGALKNPLLVMLFYGAFLVHEIRDEAQIYQSYGDAPQTDAERAGLFAALGRTAVLAFMTALAILLVLHIEITGKNSVLDRGPEWLGPTVVGIVLSLFVASLVHFRAVCRRQGTTLAAVARMHMPLVLVYGGILAVLVIGSMLGTTGLNLIILVHVSAWLVFVHHQLSKRRVEAKGAWNWLRSTPSGFLVLHLGLMFVVLVLMAVRVYVWQRVGTVSELLASKNFVYWAMFHIVLSFGGPR